MKSSSSCLTLISSLIAIAIHFNLNYVNVGSATVLTYNDDTCATIPTTVSQSVPVDGTCYSNASNGLSSSLTCNDDSTVSFKAYLSQSCSGTIVGSVDKASQKDCLKVEQLNGENAYVRVNCAASDNIELNSGSPVSASSSSEATATGLPKTGDDANINQQTGVQSIQPVSSNDSPDNTLLSTSAPAALDAVPLSPIAADGSITTLVNNGAQTGAAAEVVIDDGQNQNDINGNNSQGLTAIAGGSSGDYFTPEAIDSTSTATNTQNQIHPNAQAQAQSQANTINNTSMLTSLIVLIAAASIVAAFM